MGIVRNSPLKARVEVSFDYEQILDWWYCTYQIRIEYELKTNMLAKRKLLSLISATIYTVLVELY